MKRRSLLLALSLIAGAIISTGNVAQAAATHWVNDDAPVGANTSCADPGYNTIGAAIAAAAAGDTINVCDGVYAENVTVNKSLALNGAQAGVDARGRAATESTVNPVAGRAFTLVAGSAGSTIDGFEIAPVDGRGVESTSGPIDNLSILNNLFAVGASDVGIFLNDSGVDITVAYNSLNGGDVSSTLVHLDQDAFDGFWFKHNDVLDANGTGLFSDGTRNVGMSTARSPKMKGNLFDDNVTGANIGRKSWENAEITENTFSNNAFPGLQGGPADSMITWNTFDSNGRGGLELTGFGGSGDATRGAQNNTIENNDFMGNGFLNGGEAIFYSSGQFPGTISTNVAHNNNIEGNAAGTTYAGDETIDVECNWWGSFSGPSGDGPGTGDSANATGAGSFDFTPWLTSPAPAGECDGPVDFRSDKEDIRDEVWSHYPTGDKDTDEEITKATDHLHKSANPIYWVDGAHLMESDGTKVFDEEKKAVEKLMKLAEMLVDTWPDDAIQEILDIDRSLAQVAIDEAPAGGEKTKAEEELAKGDAERAAGDYNDAVEKYKKAWEHAQKAS